MLSTGSLAFGTTTAPQTLTITNQGSAPLIVSGLSFGGQQSGRLPRRLGHVPRRGRARVELQREIHFAPQETGDRAATLLIASNAGAAPVVARD